MAKTKEKTMLIRLSPMTTKYRTVVADPPWWPRLHQNTLGRSRGPYRAGPQRYYPLMKVEQICSMIPPAEAKAHLYLWCLNQHLDWGYQVARAWGFEPQQTLTWLKPTLGTGQFQCNTEQVLVCRKGGPAGNAFGKTGGTGFIWPRRRHSQKPDEFFGLVEAASPGPYLEMFARQRRDGWAAFGNEVQSDVQIGKAA
jgi:N6-adenosine-specific RNA methylase IME4